jgi:hypothetical protein
MPFRFRVAGVVKELESGAPRAGLEVRVFDHHWLHDDPLGTARTDAGGGFQIQFNELRFKDPFETWPDLWLHILDPSSERVLYSTRYEIRKRAHVDEHFDIAIPHAELFPPGAVA